ncbi:hypothetical protein BX070DRAFT_44933 [Coemansia spiralis]|nr:hypothetical protein BX070DRAFT_44933 [Coemansia spiralis]
MAAGDAYDARCAYLCRSSVSIPLRSTYQIGINHTAICPRFSTTGCMYFIYWFSDVGVPFRSCRHYQYNHYWNTHIACTKKDAAYSSYVTYTYGPSRLVISQSKSDALHRTLVTIIWYPITPIISLWLNVLIATITYYKNRTYLALEYVNVVLLGLQSVFLGIALIVNPVIRDVYIEQIKKRFKAARRKSSMLVSRCSPAPTTATSNTTSATLSCRIPSDELSSSISSL